MISKIIVNNKLISNLKPIRNSFKNTNNKFSAKGLFNGRKVKIYEIFDKKQGPLMEFISKHKELSEYFPNLITFDEKFIVEQWINGKTLKELSLNSKERVFQKEKIRHIINLMWSIDYKVKVFDYLKYIHDRINKKCNLDLGNLPNRINHNDLSLDNIIITSNGIKIIDNEFLGCNTGWILNFKNSFLNEDFIYNDYISKECIDQLWKVRKMWSATSLKNFSNKKWISKNLINKIRKLY
jgi:serine/threonine protein kinase